jgi:hypothetical protein
MAKRGRPTKNPAPKPATTPVKEGVTTIDIEPKWESLFNLVIGDLPAPKREQLDYFRAAVQLMDVIRQAQKTHAKGVVFNFMDGDDVKYEVIR